MCFLIKPLHLSALVPFFCSTIWHLRKFYQKTQKRKMPIVKWSCGYKFDSNPFHTYVLWITNHILIMDQERTWHNKKLKIFRINLKSQSSFLMSRKFMIITYCINPLRAKLLAAKVKIPHRTLETKSNGIAYICT